MERRGDEEKIIVRGWRAKGKGMVEGLIVYSLCIKSLV